MFERENPGFDAFVGNPPYMGGTLIGSRLGLAYHDFIVEAFPGSTGLVDIIAFFLRRSFDELRDSGTFGLLATNTVAQGDTRNAGLAAIVQQRGAIYCARRRYVWPGDAAVVVSIIHVAKAIVPNVYSLDGSPVDRISAFLMRGRADATPVNLGSNKGHSYVGCKIWGVGFLFEPTLRGARRRWKAWIDLFGRSRVREM